MTKALNVNRKSTMYKNLPSLASSSAHVPPPPVIIQPSLQRGPPSSSDHHPAGGMVGFQPTDDAIALSNNLGTVSPPPIIHAQTKTGQYITGPNGTRLIPRARKSISKTWLESLDEKPDFINELYVFVKIQTI